MEIGFNFKTKAVELMDNYEVKNFFFDYDEDFYSQTLNIGAGILENFFKDIKFQLAEGTNYLLNIRINNENFLDYDEYFTLFSVFGFVMTNDSGVNNNKNYLGVKQELREQLVATDYTLLKIMNHNYNYGTIQVCIIDSHDTEVRWASQKQ